MNQQLVLAILNGLGHDVTVVGDGRAAVAAARAGGFDVALLDIHMPDMDGFEAAAAIRAFGQLPGQADPHGGAPADGRRAREAA